MGVGETGHSDGAVVVEQLHQVLTRVDVARDVFAIVSESESLDEGGPVASLSGYSGGISANEGLSSIGSHCDRVAIKHVSVCVCV